MTEQESLAKQRNLHKIFDQHLTVRMDLGTPLLPNVRRCKSIHHKQSVRQTSTSMINVMHHHQQLIAMTVDMYLKLVDL